MAGSPFNNYDPNGAGIEDGIVKPCKVGGGGGIGPYAEVVGALAYGFKDLFGGQADIGLDRRYAIGRQSSGVGAQVGNLGANQPNDIIFIVRKQDGSTSMLTYKKGDFYWNNGPKSGKKYDGTGGNNTLWKLLKQYRRIEKSSSDVLKEQLHTLENSSYHHYIEDHGTIVDDRKNSVRKNGIPGEHGESGTQTLYDFEGSDSDLGTTTHEMQHQYDYDQGNMKGEASSPSSATDPAEIRAVHNENIGRAIDNLPLRTKYGGVKIDPKALKNPPASR